jgi:hypothetical protein
MTVTMMIDGKKSKKIIRLIAAPPVYTYGTVVRQERITTALADFRL